MRATAASVTLTALLGLSPACATGAEIIIRATSVLPDAVQAVLYEVAQPLPLRFEPGWPVESLLRSYCGGSISNLYLAQFRELNLHEPSPLAPAARAREFRLPPCPRIARNVVVQVGAADQFESLLLRELGATPATPLLVCAPNPPTAREESCRWIAAAEAVASVNGGTGARLDQLQPGRQLQLPFVSRATTVVLKPSISPTEAMRRLRDATRRTPAGEALLLIEPDPGLRLLDMVNRDSPLLLAAGCGANDPPPRNWPFDLRAAREAIVAGLAHRRQRVQRSVVRVADTGVVGLEAGDGLPAAFLARNDAEMPGARRDANHNGFLDDRWGIDADNSGDLTPVTGLDDAGRHGTLVAHLALGGRTLHATMPELSQLIGLNFARLFTTRLRTAATADAAALGSSIRAEPPLAHIINFSVGGPGEILMFRPAMEQLLIRGQLLVIAAGNERRSLAVHPLYPASYSGIPQVRPAMLVVGAHGPTGEITGFSNWGRRYVDLLAPGCRIPDALAGDAPVLHGTSAAAPLVTFTAAVLRALLPDPQPARIRDRLHASARFVSDHVAQVTAFGGVLDIPVALRPFDDVVRPVDGEPIIGRWLEEEPTAFCAGQDPPAPGEVVRVRVIASQTGGEVQLAILRRDYNLNQDEEPVCVAAPGPGPTILPERGAEPQQLAWRQVTSFVPALDLADRRVPLPGGVPTSGSRAVLVEALTAAPRTPERSALIQRIQQNLGAIGLPVGAVDGRLGPATTASVRAFQTRRNEQPTGQLTEPQIRALLR